VKLIGGKNTKGIGKKELKERVREKRHMGKEKKRGKLKCSGGLRVPKPRGGDRKTAERRKNWRVGERWGEACLVDPNSRSETDIPGVAKREGESRE